MAEDKQQDQKTTNEKTEVKTEKKSLEEKVSEVKADKNKPFEKVSKPEKTQPESKDQPTEKDNKLTTPDKKEEIPKDKKKTSEKPKVKKTEAVVNVYSLPISTKKSSAICKFIKNKPINNAISDLEEVSKVKKSVPMKGEIPHRRGKIMSGRFPIKTSIHFIKILKTLSANANVNGLENPIIVKAIANKASRPYGRFGRVQRKRTHVKIFAKEKVNKPKKEI